MWGGVREMLAARAINFYGRKQSISQFKILSIADSNLILFISLGLILELSYPRKPYRLQAS